MLFLKSIKEKDVIHTENVFHDVRRGEIYFARLNPVEGSEQGNIRPVLILQNDVGNYFSPTTIVAAITRKKKRRNFPTHVPIFMDGRKYASTIISCWNRFAPLTSHAYWGMWDEPMIT